MKAVITNLLKKGDLWFVFSILAVAAVIYIPTGLLKSTGPDIHSIAVIRHNNEIIREIDLDCVNKPYTIEIKGTYKNTILVEKGRIRYLESNCPNRICVKTGWLEKPGDTAVCIPNKTMIKIDGERNEIDGVAF
jgi:hypothetical protein